MIRTATASSSGICTKPTGCSTASTTPWVKTSESCRAECQAPGRRKPLGTHPPDLVGRYERHTPLASSGGSGSPNAVLLPRRGLLLGGLGYVQKRQISADKNVACTDKNALSTGGEIPPVASFSLSVASYAAKTKTENFNHRKVCKNRNKSRPFPVIGELSKWKSIQVFSPALFLKAKRLFNTKLTGVVIRIAITGTIISETCRVSTPTYTISICITYVTP